MAQNKQKLNIQAIFDYDPDKFDFLFVLLLIIAIFCFLRLLSFTFVVSQKILQMDFAAYFAAGRSLNHGLSPYVNNLVVSPDLWDGVDPWKHSRFLYPPIVATFFQPLGLLPYPYAKAIWNLIVLVLTGWSLILSFQFFEVKWKRYRLLWAIISVSLFFPLKTTLERGQIEAVTLFLMCFAIFKLQKEKKDLRAGFLLSLAILSKLYPALLLPFFLLAKKFRTILGVATGGVVLLIGMVALNGVPLTKDYVTVQLPRISKNGEMGSAEMLLDTNIMSRTMQGIPLGYTRLGNDRYKIWLMGFVPNASLARTVFAYFSVSKLPLFNGLNSSPMQVTLFLYGASITWLCLFSILFKINWLADAQMQGYLWMIAILTVLICSPLTWVMNLVWLLPFVAILFSWKDSLHSRGGIVLLVIGIVGFLLAAIPDHRALPLLNLPGLSPILEVKYVLSELLLLFTTYGFAFSRNRGQVVTQAARPLQVLPH